MVEGAVVVERYGEPRAVILSYQRYQQLLQIEENANLPYLVAPEPSSQTQKKGQIQAELVRQELQDKLESSLEEVMGELRGRAWSS